MSGSIAQAFEAANQFYIGQVVVRKASHGGFALSHRDDDGRENLEVLGGVENVQEVAKFDKAGKYRPLKTAPNLRRGWQLHVANAPELARALDSFYPGRLGVFTAWKKNCLPITSLRKTLERQSGMYRVAASISDSQANGVVGNFCRSDGGCLRTILWKRDESGVPASTKLPDSKFDPARDQAAPETLPSASRGMIPLLCQEPCNLLVAECRRVVKGDNP